MIQNVGRNLRRWALGAAVVSLATTAMAGTSVLFVKGEVNPAVKAPGVVPVGSLQEGYFVIQYKSKIQIQDRKDLKGHGFKIHRYLPVDALIISGEGLKLRAFADKNTGVHGVMPYSGYYKLSPDIDKISVFNQAKSVTIRLTLFTEGDLREVNSFVEKNSLGSIIDAEGRSLVLLTQLGRLPEISEIQGIEWVEQNDDVNLSILPLDPSLVGAQGKGDYSDLNGFETGTKVMNFEAAWNRGFTGAGEIVSVADTGLDTGKMGQLAVDFQNTVGGKAFGLFSKSWEDPMGHGTHVSGSVMSNGAASGGLLKGGAFEASVFAEGMWSPMLKNLSVPAKLANLFSAAYSAGARVHTNSWGGRTRGVYNNMSAQVDEYMWNNPDMLILFAAGNNGRDDDKDGRIDANSVASPGTAKNALTVGASENYLMTGGIQRPLKDLLKGEPWGVEPLASDKLSDDPNGIAAFSSIGPTNDGRRKPDLVAPGTNILSNCSHVKGSSPLWGNYNKDYCYSGGTSMSTPLTAGAAAVARQMLGGLGLKSPSAAMVKGLLMHTAFDMYPGQYGEVGRSRGQEMLRNGPNNNQGYGRVDMDRLTQVDSNNDHFVDAAGVVTGESFKYDVKNNGFKKLTVTLVYTDFPGAPSAARTLVNDLDLKVVDASGQTFSSISQVDNNEQVVIKTPVDGDFTVMVEGTNVPQGKNGRQPFALLISGR